MPKYQKAKDENHKECVDYLRDHHIWVEETDGAGRITDLITANRQNEVEFLEVKYG